MSKGLRRKLYTQNKHICISIYTPPLLVGGAAHAIYTYIRLYMPYIHTYILWQARGAAHALVDAAAHAAAADAPRCSQDAFVHEHGGPPFAHAQSALELAARLHALGICDVYVCAHATPCRCAATCLRGSLIYM